jgi:hypothetical protein
MYYVNWTLLYFYLFKLLKNSTNADLSQLSISAWNIHGLGDKIEDHIFNKI